MLNVHQCLCNCSYIDIFVIFQQSCDLLFIIYSNCATVFLQILLLYWHISSFTFSSMFCPEKQNKTMSHVNITMLFFLLSNLYALSFPRRVLHSFFFLSFASASVCRIVCTSLYYVYVSQLNNRMTMLVCVACMCCLYVLLVCVACMCICCVNVTKWVTI